MHIAANFQRLAALTLFLLSGVLLHAQTDPGAPKLETAEAIAKAATTLKEVRPGVFAIGNLELDKSQRTVSFPAELHMTNGPLEYLLVSAHGKRHESLLLTEIQPVHVHAAMLLIGVKSGSNSVNAGASLAAKAEPLEKPSSANLPGSKVAVQVEWTLDGKTTVRRGEELIKNTQNANALREGHWIYNGSTIVNKIFTAQLFGDIISLVTDPAALMNNEATGHDNDDVWVANLTGLPPLKTPVRVRIQLQESAIKDGKNSKNE